jgi:hypothetical protein
MTNKEDFAEKYFADIKDDIFLFSVLIALESIMILTYDRLKTGSEHDVIFQIALISVFTLILIIWLKTFFKALDIFENVRVQTFITIFTLSYVIFFPLLLGFPIMALAYAIYNLDQLNFVGSLTSVLLFLIIFSGIIGIKYLQNRLLNYTIKKRLPFIGVFSFLFFVLIGLLYYLFYDPIVIILTFLLVLDIFYIWVSIFPPRKK